MDDDIHELVKQAQSGSREALEGVLHYAQGYIYNLALRMLQLPADAEDATQEILIKLMTHLGQFRGDSHFSTWMYRLASNTLLNLRQRDREQNNLSFEALSQRLEYSLARYEDTAEEAYESAQLTEEVRRSCTLGMLLCLNRKDRMALILAELLEVSSDERAAIMEMSSAAFRKRLSRARQSIVAFVSAQCGLVNPDSPCRCNKHIANKIQAGKMSASVLVYPQPHDASSHTHLVNAQSDSIDRAMRSLALLRSHPHYASPIEARAMLDDIFNGQDWDR